MVIGPQAMGQDEYLPGQSLPGTVYRIVRLIGEGGVERVYEVEDSTIGKRYALKTLGDAQADARELADKLRESRIFAKVADPHVVDVCAAGVSSDGQCFYVMELFDGEPLDAVLRRQGRLQLGAVLSVGIELSEALASVHAVGVVHRHVKPDNIFIAPGSPESPSTRLLDLAVASALAGSGTSWRTVHGTFGYASPEQLRGEPASPLMDIWSLGCVLYEAFSGQLPFEVSSDWRTFVDGVLGPAPAPRLSDISPDAPADLVSLVARMLQKEPSRRLPRADMATATLRRIERRLSSRPPPPAVDPNAAEQPAQEPAGRASPAAADRDALGSRVAAPQPKATAPVAPAPVEALASAPAIPAAVEALATAPAIPAAVEAPATAPAVSAAVEALASAPAVSAAMEALASAPAVPAVLPAFPSGGLASAPAEASTRAGALPADLKAVADVAPAHAEPAARPSPVRVPPRPMLPPPVVGADLVDEDWDLALSALAPAPSPGPSEAAPERAPASAPSAGPSEAAPERAPASAPSAGPSEAASERAPVPSAGPPASPREPVLPSVVIAADVAAEAEDTLVGTMADFLNEGAGPPPEQLLPSVVIAADVAAEAEDTLVGTMADFLDESAPEAASEPVPSAPPHAAKAADVTPLSQRRAVPEAPSPRQELRRADSALALPPAAAAPFSEPQASGAVPERPPRVTYALLFLSVLVAWMVVALFFLRARRSAPRSHAR